MGYFFLQRLVTLISYVTFVNQSECIISARLRIEARAEAAGDRDHDGDEETARRHVTRWSQGLAGVQTDSEFDALGRGVRQYFDGLRVLEQLWRNIGLRWEHVHMESSSKTLLKTRHIRNGPPTQAFMFTFVLFKHKFTEKNCRLHRDSNSDRQSRRRARWPQPRSKAFSVWTPKSVSHLTWICIVVTNVISLSLAFNRSRVFCNREPNI